MKSRTRILGYELLGFFSNYVGGFDPENSLLQRIPSGEPGLLELLLEVGRKILQSEDLEDDLSVDEYNAVYSSSLCSVLAEILDEEVTANGQLDWSLLTFTPVRRRFSQKEQGNQERIAFLRGAYKRHKSTARAFRFANDYDKALVVQQQLMWFADEDDELTWKSTFLTPYVHHLSFRKGGELDSLIL